MGLFDFGKKRRSKSRVSKSKAHRKPPSKLLRICKKYRVKATKKVGGKRVYKSVSVLKKLCLRKAMALRKKLMKAHKRSMKHKKTSTRRRKVVRRRADFGEEAEASAMEFGARRRRRASAFGAMLPMNIRSMMGPKGGFGKRRRVGASKKVSKKMAMKAFRSFYQRHCAGRRGMGFGNGGNPALSQSMGYSFCPDGMGGVLGPYSTGLYATPCQSPSSSGQFGARRRRRASAIGARHNKKKTVRRSKKKTIRRRRYNVAGSPCNKLKKRVCRSNPNCSYTKRGCRRRAGTKGGSVVFEGPALAYGARRRSTRRRSSRF